MEHSTLHALQLTGIIVALAGPLLALGILLPARRKLAASDAAMALAQDLESNAVRWAIGGALVGAVATFLDFFVQVAEVQGQTIFGGVPLETVVRFATATTVGRLGLGRIALLLLAALALRFADRLRWLLALPLALGATLCTGLVSHAAAQPEHRLPAIVLQVVHISAGAAWIGVLIHLLASRRQIVAARVPGEIGLISEVVNRFSPVALTAASLLALSGVIAAVRYLVTPAAVPTSAYGLTLFVKLALLVPVLFAGFTNFRIVRPALARLFAGEGKGNPAEAPPEPLRLFGRMLELEVTAGILVIAVAGILGSVSPPFEDGGVRLTSPQVHALLSPDLPTAAIVDPGSFYGAATRTVDDLRYAEFTHNWSGVMVTLLGVFWLLQSLGGRSGALAARGWPLLMIPFAIFIAVAADPEVFILRQLPYTQAIQDPQILEHQIGAALVLVLVWFGWRDRQRVEAQRPMGFLLPALMIFGSLLLLGHAHSFLTNSQELTNLINVQHAIFGACGLFAGTVRWLQLRELFPARVARPLWPAFVIVLGIFMTFFYREVV